MSWVAVGVGLLLLALALSKNKVEYFRCWNCNRVILRNSYQCPYCKAHNSFGGVGGA